MYILRIYIYICACVYEKPSYTSAYSLVETVVVIANDKIWLHLDHKPCVYTLYMVAHHITQNVKAQLIAAAVDEGSCIKKSPWW